MSRVNSILVSGIILLTLLGAVSFTAAAHPGSGIVVDTQGNVFFQDGIARTIWKIDPQSKITAHYDKLGGKSKSTAWERQSMGDKRQSAV